MKTHNNKLYITNQLPLKPSELVDRLIDLVPGDIGWVWWNRPERKLYFLTEAPKSNVPEGQFYCFNMINEKLQEEDSFQMPVVFPKLVGEETKEGQEVFAEVGGKRWVFVATLSNGQFLVADPEDRDDLKRFDVLWEEGK